MGTRVINTGIQNPALPSLFDLSNNNTGLVNHITEIENELNHPDVFVVAATSCNLGKIGIPVDYKINGSGAGLTWEKAHFAAIGETLERYCLSVIYREDLKLASAQELADLGFDHIPPEDWSLFAPDQSVAPYVPFTNDTQIAWTIAQSLTANIEKFVPASLVYLPYYSHFKEEGECVIAPSISTGAACAVNRQEAILKGIAELIERDSFMIMWKNRIACEKVCIDAKSLLYKVLQKNFLRPGLTYDIFYTHFDFEMPSFFGVLRDDRNGYTSRVVGGAAHPDPNVAVLKTLIELVQSLVWKDHKGQKQFPDNSFIENVRSFEDRMELYSYNDMSEAMDFLPTEETIDLSSIPVAYQFDEVSISESLNYLLQDFKIKGYEVLAVDMTSVEAEHCNANVIRVLIPALEVMEGEYEFQYLGGKRWKEIPYLLNLKAENEKIVLNKFPHPYP